MEARKIRDPIHDFVSLTGKECEIIGTRIFQRLRGIKQLAFAYLVYPSALHTRFEHSLGVCHIAGLISESLRLKDEETRIVRLASLLHDLGHGPFSHVSELILEVYADRKAIKERASHREKIHELITYDIIRMSSDLDALVGKGDLEKIIQMLSRGYGEPCLRSIVSGPLDADKQDYLLRDSHSCGVKYGVFDLAQLHRALRAVEDPTDKSMQLMISDDGVHAFEQFILAKYYMTTQVYSHKVRIITDMMIARAIRLGIEVDGIDELRELFLYDGSSDFIKGYVEWDDSRFLLYFGGDGFKGKLCWDFLARLSERRLLKRIYRKEITALSAEARDPISRISEPESMASRAALEKSIFGLLESRGIRFRVPTEDQFHYIIVHAYTTKSVRTQSRDDESAVLIDKRPLPKPFEQESTLFRSIDEKLSEAFVEVFAPVTYDTVAERRVLLDTIDQPITEILNGYFKGETINAHA